MLNIFVVDNDKDILTKLNFRILCNRLCIDTVARVDPVSLRNMIICN